jgi:hypothetical protein
MTLFQTQDYTEPGLNGRGAAFRDGHSYKLFENITEKMWWQNIQRVTEKCGQI